MSTWQSGSSRAFRSPSSNNQGTGRDLPPLPWPSSVEAGPSALQRKTSLTEHHARSPISSVFAEAAYGSDDNISTPGSFTRTTAGLSLTTDSEIEDDDPYDDDVNDDTFFTSVIEERPTVAPASLSVSSQKKAVAPSLGRAQTVSESWDDDFEFSEHGSEKPLQSKVDDKFDEQEERILDNSSDEGSLWDSYESDREHDLSPSNGAVANVNRNERRLARTASSVTIVPRGESQKGQIAPNSRNSERHSNLQASLAQSSPTARLAMRPCTPSKQPSSSKTAFSDRGTDAHTHAKQVLTSGLENQSKQKSSISLKYDNPLAGSHADTPPRISSLQADLAPSSSSQQNTSPKRRSFRMSKDSPWSKLFTSKLGRRKPSNADLKDATRSATSTYTQDNRHMRTPEQIGKSPVPVVDDSTRRREFGLVPYATASANRTLPSEGVVDLRSPPETSDPKVDIMQYKSRARHAQKGSPGSSERRQWASMLEDNSPPKRVITSFHEKRNRRNGVVKDSSVLQRAGHEFSKPLNTGVRSGKRKDLGSIDVEESGQGQSYADNPVDPPSTTHMFETQASALRGLKTGARDLSHRSLSASTAASAASSSEPRTSVASTMTDVTSDSRKESPDGENLVRILPRSSQFATEEAVLLDSKEPYQKRPSRTSLAKRPPPVSGGLGSLARRQQSGPSLTVDTFAASEADDPSKEQKAVGSEVPVQSSRRNSYGDLKIPARITVAQDALRADMSRIRNFAKGIEELKSLRIAHQALSDRLAGKVGRMNSYDALEDLQRAEYSYSTWWECAEVLIGLADGKEEEGGYETNVNHTTLRKRADSSHRRPRISPTPSLQSTLESNAVSVQRRTANAASSRTSSTASRFVAPERERDILAAMLAGTPLDQTPPSQWSLSQSRISSPIVHGERVSPGTTRKRHSHSMQRSSIDVRRTSDPIDQTASATITSKKMQQVITASGDPTTKYFPNQSLIPTSLDSSDSHLEKELSRRESGGRHRLRSAGQMGLQGLRDLVWTIKTNSTVSKPRKNAFGSQVSLLELEPRERKGSSASQRERPPPTPHVIERAKSEATAHLEGTHDAPRSDQNMRPFFVRAPASAPASNEGEFFSGSHQRYALRRSVGHGGPSRTASGSSAADVSTDISLGELSADSQWTDAVYDASFHAILDNRKSSHHRSHSVFGNGLPSNPTSRRQDRFAGWLGFHGSLPTSSLGQLRNKSEASLPRPLTAESKSVTNKVIPPPQTFVDSSRPFALMQQSYESVGSGISGWSSDKQGTRMRVMSADHADAAIRQPDTASSEAYRKLAMRPEAMPSLNRYLEATSTRCRECIASLNKIETHLEGDAR